MGTHPIFESDFDCLTVFRLEMSEPKTGPELALLRVKRKQRKMRRDIDKMNKQAQVHEENRIEASLIGELKAAQSNNRNAKMKDTVYEAISVGAQRLSRTSQTPVRHYDWKHYCRTR